MDLLFFAKEKKPAGLQVPSHSHNCFEIVFYGNNASGYSIIDNVKYEIKPHCVAVVGKNRSHSEAHLSETTVSFIGIDEILNIPAGVYYDMHELKSIFKDIAAEIENQNDYFSDIINLKINEILILLKRSLTRHSNNVKELTFFKNYIDENYMNIISVKKMSELSGYSYDHFRHLFTDTFGISPQKYIIECRIKNALEYLITTDLSCTKIAYLCGFSDSSQMTKMFKEKHNATPKQLRAVTDDFKSE